MSDIKFKRSNSTPNSHVSVDSSSVAFKTLAAPESPEEHGLLGCAPRISDSGGLGFSWRQNTSLRFLGGADGAYWAL